MTIINETTSPLYAACVGFMASERGAFNSWEKVAAYIQGRLDAGGTSENFVAEFKAVERQIKSDFKIAVMPKAWRSAKSTALKAVGAGLSLMDSSTKGVYGKTTIERSLKAMSKPSIGVGATPSPADAIVALIVQCVPHIDNMKTITSVNRDRILNNLGALSTLVLKIPTA